MPTFEPIAAVRHHYHGGYGGSVLIMTGFLPQSPALVTSLRPNPCHRLLPPREEREERRQFGAHGDAVAAVTPCFVPRLRGGTVSTPG